jgi:hypothetical protein
MISTIDPITRLNLLKEYMWWWIARWPDSHYSFDKFLYRHYPVLIPGTPEHCKAIATHCFYCGKKFGKPDKDKATLDHFVPESKGVTEKFVICCMHCNSYKSDTMPNDFIKKVTIAELRGWKIFGLQGEKLKHAFKQVHKIQDDLLYNMGPKVYYIKK